MNDETLVSILIVTDDHPPDLDEFFGALISQTVGPSEYEIILVDVSHTHDYEDAISRISKVKPEKLRLSYHKIDKGGRASGYNFAFKQSSGDLIIFFGDDYVAPDRLVEVHREFHIRHPEEYKTGVGSAVFEGKMTKDHFAMWLQGSGELYGVPFGPDMTSIPENFFYIGNTSVKRSFLEKVGAFDEMFPHHAWDDYELGLRMSEHGMVATFIPEAKARHQHEIDLAERCHVMVHAGRSAKLFEKKYPGSHGWQSKLRRRGWKYRLNALKWKLLHKLTAKEKYLIRHYRAELDLSFCEGYYGS